MFHASSAIATVKITGQASVTFLPLWNHFTCWSVNETLCENFTLQRLDSYLAFVTVASNRWSKSRRENDFFFQFRRCSRIVKILPVLWKFTFSRARCVTRRRLEMNKDRFQKTTQHIWQLLSVPCSLACRAKNKYLKKIGFTLPISFGTSTLLSLFIL